MSRSSSPRPQRNTGRKGTDVPLYVVDGLTKQNVHDQLVLIITKAAERGNAMRMLQISKMGVVDALAPGEADRIVRDLAKSDSSLAWQQVRAGLPQLQDVIAIYRRMDWQRGDRSGPRIGVAK